MSAAALSFACAALTALGVAHLLPRGATRPRGAGGHRLVRVLAAAGSRGAARRVTPRDLELRIAAAGNPGGLSARDVMAAKLAAAALAGAGGTLPAAVAPGRLGVLVTLAAPVAGFLAPDMWLARRAAARARAVRRVLPEMLDLLRVTVDAGASLSTALGEVGARASGPLAAEWGAVASEVTFGVPLERALAGMARRLPQPEVQALCAALERSRRHGAPLGRTLAGQARDTRVALRRHLQEEAAKAGPKIQLVVALMLVPSVLLMVAAALAAALLGSGDLPEV